MALRLMNLATRLPVRALRIGVPVQARWGLAAKSFATAVDDEQSCVQLLNGITQGLNKIHKDLDIIKEEVGTIKQGLMEDLDIIKKDVNILKEDMNINRNDIGVSNEGLGSNQKGPNVKQELLSNAEKGSGRVLEAVSYIKAKISANQDEAIYQRHNASHSSGESSDPGDVMLASFKSYETGDEVENFPLTVNHLYTYDAKAVDDLHQALSLSRKPNVDLANESDEGREHERKRKIGEILFDIGVLPPVNKYFPMRKFRNS